MNGLLGMPTFGSLLGGFNIVSSPYLSSTEWKQVKFPRSKKVRIRKKWSKQRKNFASVPTATVYQMGNTLYMHPAIEAKFRKSLLPNVTT